MESREWKAWREQEGATEGPGRAGMALVWCFVLAVGLITAASGTPIGRGWETGGIVLTGGAAAVTMALLSRRRRRRQAGRGDSGPGGYSS